MENNVKLLTKSNKSNYEKPSITPFLINHIFSVRTKFNQKVPELNPLTNINSIILFIYPLPLPDFGSCLRRLLSASSTSLPHALFMTGRLIGHAHIRRGGWGWTSAFVFAARTFLFFLKFSYRPNYSDRHFQHSDFWILRVPRAHTSVDKTIVTKES